MCSLVFTLGGRALMGVWYGTNARQLSGHDDEIHRHHTCLLVGFMDDCYTNNMFGELNK